MKEKVNVTGVPETMVQTLYARAKETRKKNAKINDEIAVELVKNLEYDFSKADKDKAMNYGVIARTIMVLILPISIRFSLEMYLRLLTVYSHQNRDQEQVITRLVKSEMEKH